MIRLLLKEPFRWYVEGLTRPFKHEVDAGAVGVGAVLLQDLQGLDRPVCYYSCKFNKTLLLGCSMSPVVLYTDHNPLIFLARMFNHNQHLVRWAVLLQEYNLSIHHKNGSENVLAEGLSRL